MWKRSPGTLEICSLPESRLGNALELLSSKHKADILLNWAIIPIKTNFIKHC